MMKACRLRVWCLLSVVAIASPAIGLEHEALKYGTPNTGYLIDYGTYVMSYDGRLRSAQWVAEKLTKASLSGTVERSNDFRPDRGIPGEFRSELSDYYKSGYDRGHLAPAGDHRLSSSDNSKTFFLTNMSPQIGVGFNRSYWKRLETSVRARVLQPSVKELYVFSGPLFMPDNAPRQGQETGTYDGDEDAESGDEPLTVTYRYIGGNHVPVPTHYFKAILIVPADEERSVQLYTFVLPNRKIDKDTDIDTFARSVDYLEHWAGFDLWSELDDETEAFKEGTAWGNWGPLDAE